MKKTKREVAFEKDIYEASESVADIALWLDIRSARKEQKALSSEEYRFLFYRLDEALGMLDFHPDGNSGYTYQG